MLRVSMSKLINTAGSGYLGGVAEEYFSRVSFETRHLALKTARVGPLPGRNDAVCGRSARVHILRRSSIRRLEKIVKVGGGDCSAAMVLVVE
jgi:hypothetical protein